MLNIAGSIYWQIEGTYYDSISIHFENHAVSP
jgi:hypothetical protein